MDQSLSGTGYCSPGANEAALAFASRRAVELGKTRTVLLTRGDTTGAQGHLALVCATAPTLTQCTNVWRKWTQTHIIGFGDGFSCLQKHSKFPCINTKMTF